MRVTTERNVSPERVRSSRAAVTCNGARPAWSQRRELTATISRFLDRILCQLFHNEDQVLQLVRESRGGL